MTGTQRPPGEPEPFVLVSTDSGEWWCRITLSGELDMATAPRVRQAVDEALHRGRRQVAIDASRVSFVDSSGLVALIAARRDVTAAGGTLRLTAVSATVNRVLELAGLADELLGRRR